MSQGAPADNNQGDADNQISQWRSLPRWLRAVIQIAVWLAGCIVYLVVVTIGLYLLSWFVGPTADPVTFITTNLLTAVLAALVAVQAYIYHGQLSTMRGSLEESRREIERVTRPRLRITEVRVENFEASKEPVFVVSIKNDGATDAIDVGLTIRVSFGHPLDGTLAQKWKEPQVVTIPAGQEQHYFIPWGSPIPQERIDDFNRSVPLRVSGFIEHPKAKMRNFCYRYYPWEDGERPTRVAQFIPCDFKTALVKVVTPQVARLKLTTYAPDVINQMKPPEVAKPQDETKAESEDNREKPN